MCICISFHNQKIPFYRHQGSSPVCVCIWLFSLPLLENAFPVSHLEGFLFVYVQRRCLMLSLSWNIFPYISNLNDFTPLCLRTCHFRLHLFENTLEHILYLKALYIACPLQYEFVNDFFTDSTCRSVCSFLLLEEPLLYISSISFSDIPATLCWSRFSVVLPLYCWVVKMCWLWQNKQYYFTQLYIFSTKQHCLSHPIRLQSWKCHAFVCCNV